METRRDGIADLLSVLPTDGDPIEEIDADLRAAGIDLSSATDRIADLKRRLAGDQRRKAARAARLRIEGWIERLRGSIEWERLLAERQRQNLTLAHCATFFRSLEGFDAADEAALSEDLRILAEADLLDDPAILSGLLDDNHDPR